MRITKADSLLFDEAIIKSFREDSSRNRKRYAGMIVLSVLLFFFGSEFIFMAKDIVGILMDILITIGLAGCGVDQSDRGKDLQGLSQIEIYSLLFPQAGRAA